MSPLALRRTLFRFAAAGLLLAAGIASAQTMRFAPSVIGTPMVLEGRLEVLVEDYADGHSRVRHFLDTQQGRIELAFARKPPQLPSGTRVRVHGRAQADALALDGSTGSIDPLTTVMPNTMGEQSIAVLLVNFQDDASQPKTIAEARNLVLGDVSNHYLESSFGQTWFNGQVFGWYTIAMSKTVCNPQTLASLADAKAAEAGVSIGSYQRRVYMFPTNACGWQGLGNVGGDGTVAWVNGLMTLQVVGHELGHNYGLSHAHSLDCDTGVFGDKCVKYVYGDAADLMGNLRAGQFNPFEKEQLGWLNDGISPPIITAATSGRYSIEPYSASTVGPKALKIPRGTDSDGRNLWYYVEYRQPIGGDGVLADVGNLTRGVMVRTATEGDPESSFQLDMSPGSSSSYYDESGDGALAVGQTHVDTDVGVTMTPVSASSTGADIDVVIQTPVCTRATPSVSLVGGGTGVAAGSAVGYTLSVTNRDNRLCPATNFALSSSVPAGWGSTLTSSSMTVGPGTTASTTLIVASQATAAAGDYGISVATSSADSALHAATASATFAVAPCTRAAPTVSLTGGGTGVRAGTDIAYTLNITNRDGGTCPATTFALASSVPEGWTGALGTPRVTLRGGESASTGLNVTSDANAAVGSYGIGAAASSPVGALHTANASATYNVSETCTRAAPTITLAGGGTAVVPGTVVGYAVNITNRDSSACSTTTFSLARSVPAGWTGTLSNGTVALNPGATGSAVLNVTSPAAATGGSYSVGVAASSPLGVPHTASASTRYLVAPKLYIADASLIEGNSGTTMANFVVSLTQPAVVPVTFNAATANVTAAAGSDYTATSRIGVTIPVGSTTATISVPVAGDIAVEGTETFKVTVNNVVGATLADGTAIGTIRNDDALLSIGDVAIVEGSSGTKAATFTVKLSTVSASPVTFNIATANNSAVAGSDYVARSSAAQTISPGASSMTFTVNVAGDAAVEANETFFVNVANVKGATVADAQAVGTIRNDDAALSIADASITEGQSNTKSLNFTVRLSAISAAQVSFNLATANKTAVAGSDYVALAFTGQSIPAGTPSKAFAVVIKGDTAKEVNETFVVNVGNVVGATVGDAQALGTIVNDD